MKEYKIAKGWAIFIWIMAPVLIGLFGFLGVMPFIANEIDLTLVLILTPVSIGMVTLMVFGLIDIQKGRFIIDNEKLISIGVFKIKELDFNEIKGYTVNEQYIFIIPKDNRKKKIKISQYIGGYREVLLWISEKFEDLDIINKATEEQEILIDESIGWSREIRDEKLLNARKITKLINLLGIITFAWALFYPKPYDYAVFSSLIIPLVAVLAIKFSGGLIRLDKPNGSAYPSVVYALIFPSMGLMVRSIFDYDIFDYSNVWVKSIAVMISLLVVLLIKQKEITFKKKQDFLSVASAAMFLWVYGFGAAIYLNCNLDNSEPEHFTAKILDKRVSTGNHTSYYLELTSWGPQRDIDEVSVSRSLYDRVEVDNNVNIYFRNGKLEIPWFVVTDRQRE